MVKISHKSQDKFLLVGSVGTKYDWNDESSKVKIDNV